MTIEAVKLDGPIAIPAQSANTAAATAPVSASVAPPQTASASTAAAAQRAQSANQEVDEQEVVTAARDLQTYFSNMSPKFTVDYLSGLSVVQMRAASTGEVVFQIPNTQAVRLARLVRDGASLGSLPFVETEA